MVDADNNDNGNYNDTDADTDADMDFEEHILAEKERKRLAQILTAKRSLITNLAFTGYLIVTHAIIALLPATERIFYSVIVFSLFKGSLPILTAIANFGTIQSVVRNYWNYLRNK